MRDIIYLWCSPIGNSGDVIGYAMLENGKAIASHWSSNADWSKHDMGYENSNWKHDSYLKACPNGYSLVWLDDPESDEGWQKAYALNQSAKPISETALKATP